MKEKRRIINETATDVCEVNKVVRRPRTKIVEEEVNPSPEGGVDVTTTTVKGDQTATSSVNKIKLKQIKKQEKITNKNNRVDATAKNNQDKKDTNKRVDVITPSQGSNELDSIVSNLKDTKVMHAVKESSSSLKKRVMQLKQEQEETDVDNQKTSGEILVSGAQDINESIETDLDAYLDKMVAMPRSKDGVKMAESMRPHLNKLTLKQKTGITEADIEKIVQVIERNPIDYKNIATVCPEEKPGEKLACPHLDCPFKTLKKIPSGERCPIELSYIDFLLRQYLIEVLLDEDDILGAVEYNLVVSLVDCDITDIRIRGMMTTLGYLIPEITVNPKTGKEVVNEKINPIIDLMKANDKRKGTVLKQLLATPEIKERLNIRRVKDKNKAIYNRTEKDKRIKTIIAKVKEHKQLAGKGLEDGEKTDT